MKESDFKDTFFVVRATDFELFCLWRETHETHKMEQDNCGIVLTIGECDNRPVALSLFRYKIDGKWVVFYEATSQVVDYKLVEEWVKENLLVHTPKWDNNQRASHCNGMNFHLCLSAIREAS